MQFVDGIPVWGDLTDAGALRQIKNCARTADAAALMADHHLGYAVPIGGVVAYEDKISPSGVGYDIACGNKAVLLDLPASEVRAKIKTIMDDIWTHLSFGIGRKNNVRVDHELFDDPAWSIRAIAPLKSMASAQLGTIGSGNHYVDLFEDEQGRSWIGVHFGSRGFGHKTATYFLEAGGAKDGMEVDPLVLDARSSLGADYLACMTLAGRYAYAGRDWVCNEVARLLGANILEEVHNHHNFAWRERHGEHDVIVHRKGATPADKGVLGIIPGSMATPAYLVEGLGNEQSLRSASHGAGRRLSRSAAVKQFTWPQVKRLLTERGVTLLSAGLDEAPWVYKDIDEVMAAQQDLVRILAKFTPRIVKMSPAGERPED